MVVVCRAEQCFGQQQRNPDSGIYRLFDSVFNRVWMFVLFAQRQSEKELIV
jgi:hypothetical protein